MTDSLMSPQGDEHLATSARDLSTTNQPHARRRELLEFVGRFLLVAVVLIAIVVVQPAVRHGLGRRAARHDVQSGCRLMAGAAANAGLGADAKVLDAASKKFATAAHEDHRWNPLANSASDLSMKVEAGLALDRSFLGDATTALPAAGNVIVAACAGVGSPLVTQTPGT